jgi:hypothetical protein
MVIPVLAMSVLAGCGATEPQKPTAQETAAKAEKVAATNRAEQVFEATQRQEGEIARLRAEVRRAKRERAAVDAQSSREGTAPRSGRDPVGAALLSRNDRSSFRRLEASLGGRSGVAISGVGPRSRVSQAGSFQSAVAWSTSKVPVAMAAIAAGTAEPPDLTQAITASDNQAAEALWSSLGGGKQAASAANEQLRLGGDDVTQMQASVLRSGYTSFGQTSWSLKDQTAFTAGMGCTTAGRQVLALMAKTLPAQRWGLGAVGWSASIKGGWGPGASPGQAGAYIDRQMGVLATGNRKLAVSIMTQPAAGSHEAGTANLTKIARWVVAHVDRDSLPPAKC